VSVADASVAISAAAFAVSLSTLHINRRRDKRDLFLRVHERLAAVEQQRGRKFLYEMREQRRSVAEVTTEEREVIDHALSMLNVACFYFVRRYISRKDLKRQWALSIVRTVNAAEPYIAYRDAQRGTQTWPDLLRFTSEARKFVQKEGLGAALDDYSIDDEQLGTSAL
jgi:hypothetical protein